ncbi:hypothetical protein WJX82_007482 [Trebouxia sp. C0006]
MKAYGEAKTIGTVSLLPFCATALSPAWQVWRRTRASQPQPQTLSWESGHKFGSLQFVRLSGSVGGMSDQGQSDAKQGIGVSSIMRAGATLEKHPQPESQPKAGHLLHNQGSQNEQ